MADERGFLGGGFDNCAILFFILIFLCLFTGFGGFGFGYKE
jgi:hypothetical protein